MSPEAIFEMQFPFKKKSNASVFGSITQAEGNIRNLTMTAPSRQIHKDTINSKRFLRHLINSIVRRQVLVKAL